MGKTKGPYTEEFPVGSTVRIAESAGLRNFAREWKWHHPLQPYQFDFAGQTAKIESVSFYQGGDELYTLDAIPGIWHEACLEAQRSDGR